MSSKYRTTVISKIVKEFTPQSFEGLGVAVQYGLDNADYGDKITVEEVIRDSCGDYIPIDTVMSFVKREDLN